MNGKSKAVLKVSMLFAAAIYGTTIEAADYYAGKRIEVFLPVPAGGGLDRNAKTFLRIFRKHVPGKPTIVVKNMPGGGGQRAVNFVFNKGGEKGLRLLWGPINLAGILVGLPGIRYKPEEFKPLGVFAFPIVTIVRTDLIPGGIKSPADLLKAKNFVNAGRIPGGSLGTYGVLSYSILGLKYRHSIGYRGQPKLKAAIIQNEIQSLSTGNPGYWVFYKKDLIKKGVVIAPFYHPVFNPKSRQMFPVDKDFYGKGIDPFPVYYKKVKGKEPAGPTYEVYKWWSTYANWANWFLAPPNTPPEQLKALRAAYAATSKDKELLNRFRKRNRRIPEFLIGAQAEAVTKGFRKMSKAAVAELTNILKGDRK